MFYNIPDVLKSVCKNKIAGGVTTVRGVDGVHYELSVLWDAVVVSLCKNPVVG